MMKSRINFLAGLSMAVVFTACHSDEETPVYSLDRENSTVEWHGAGLAAQHTGAFKVEEEELIIENERITHGNFIVPISSITNFDLPEEVKPTLLGHLMTPDFFYVALYPTASFTITTLTPYSGNAEGAIENANFYVKGTFTMIGKTNPIEFPARIIFKDNQFTVEALLSIDRTKWGMNYMADEATAQEHYIYKEVNLHIKLAGLRK